MVVLDATMLLLLLSPNATAPTDAATGKPVEHAQQRLEGLLKQLEADRTKIIVPAPALSEILVRAGKAGPEYLDRLNRSSAFRIVSFDIRAAVEVAQMTRSAIDSGNKRTDPEATWAKIKYDRQIVAIARVENASIIYSDDRHIRRLAADAGMSVIGIAEVPLPDDLKQMDLLSLTPPERPSETPHQGPTQSI